jgi:indole-3-glycerol phosphate synthase
MANLLDKIIQDKKESLRSFKKNRSLESLENKIKTLNNFLNFKETIVNNKGVSLITEIKKASPSAGILVKDFNYLNIAKMYIENKATCLSVLTEEKYFLGKLEYIKGIKDKFKIPILAKDFFIDPYQISLSKSYGCDCVLLIIAALDNKQTDEIYAEALRHKLSVIVEVHNDQEAKTALKYEEALIGINNRNLKTLDISINNTISIFEILKDHKNPLISESGIKDEADARYIYEKTGIKNFLIGESLLKSNNPTGLMKKITRIIE